MHKNNYSALFAVVMILMLVPFAPAIVESQFNEDTSLKNTFSGIQTAYANPQHVQTTDYISAGYIGQYGPNQKTNDAKVLGIATQRDSSPPPYQAQEIDKSNSTLNLDPGTAITVWVDFLNTGQSTWYNTGDHFVAMNVTNPAGRHSEFQHKFWGSDYYRPSTLLQNEVRPGEIGRFVFALQAPDAKGTYFEEFHLVAENLTWIDGGYTTFKIGVGEKVSYTPDYQAEEISRTKGGTIDAEPGTAFTFEINYKNTGLKTWYNTGNHFAAMNVVDPIGRHSVFQHEYWPDYYYRPAKLLQSRIYPGEIGTFRFAIQAPNIEGYYTEKIALVAENLTWIEGSEISLPFKIGNPVAKSNDTVAINSAEPKIRVGLYNTNEPITITANGSYNIINMNDSSTISKLSGEATTITPGVDSYWRIGGTDINTILEISSYESRPTWKPELNDNTFRGVIEIRYSEATEKIWIINELPIESYLRGLAEVSNKQPNEYLKSLIISARSYALWHQVRGGKHANEYFDLNNFTDQVYRGYGFEQRSIDPIKAVEVTAGQIITHPEALSSLNPDCIALATYSSGTDGRTRDWTEVWSGDGFPWLISVDDPIGAISNWDTLTANHMVGMSASGARAYAIDENKTYDWILKHYYTGISIAKIY
ncbi:MAG: SpoIID/LytB domain-containing protein [Candidatus Kerfeldbacteria bacterium]